MIATDGVIAIDGVIAALGVIRATNTNGAIRAALGVIRATNGAIRAALGVIRATDGDRARRTIMGLTLCAPHRHANRLRLAATSRHETAS